jgi:hypothetical protein
MENEQTSRLIVIHCYEREEDIPASLAEQLKIIDRIYPQLRVDLLLVKGCFGPELIEQISRRLGVPRTTCSSPRQGTASPITSPTWEGYGSSSNCGPLALALAARGGCRLLGQERTLITSA